MAPRAPSVTPTKKRAPSATPTKKRAPSATPTKKRTPSSSSRTRKSSSASASPARTPSASADGAAAAAAAAASTASSSSSSSVFSGRGRLWSSNAAKADAEWFYLKAAVWWVGLMVVVVSFRVYKLIDAHFCNEGYVSIGVLAVLPYLWHGLRGHESERALPFYARFSFKMNVWVALFGFVGNFFWTHYFYTQLGAKFTFCEHLGGFWGLNNVPIVNYVLTHAYFLMYFTLSNMALRLTWTSMRAGRARIVAVAFVVVLLAYITAFMEAYTLENFPYYVFSDRQSAYLKGSALYALYFLVGFPMVWRLDEDGVTKYTVFRAATESLASAMLVFILLDLWRLLIGNIAPAIAAAGVPYAN